MYIKVWDRVQMHVRRASFAVIAGGIVGCTSHTIPSSALAQLPFAGHSVSAMNSGGALLPDAKTYGSTPLFDDQSRVARLANFNLSEPEPCDIASPLNLDPRVAMLAKFVRYRRRRSEGGASHAFDLTVSRGESMKAKTCSIAIIADDALYMMRQSPVEAIVSLTVIAPN